MLIGEIIGYFIWLSLQGSFCWRSSTDPSSCSSSRPRSVYDSSDAEGDCGPCDSRLCSFHRSL